MAVSCFKCFNVFFFQKITAKKWMHPSLPTLALHRRNCLNILVLTVLNLFFSDRILRDKSHKYIFFCTILILTVCTQDEIMQTVQAQVALANMQVQYTQVQQYSTLQYSIVQYFPYFTGKKLWGRGEKRGLGEEGRVGYNLIYVYVLGVIDESN